jgi:hypothetical protein
MMRSVQPPPPPPPNYGHLDERSMNAATEWLDKEYTKLTSPHQSPASSTPSSVENYVRVNNQLAQQLNHSPAHGALLHGSPGPKYNGSGYGSTNGTPQPAHRMLRRQNMNHESNSPNSPQIIMLSRLGQGQGQTSTRYVTVTTTTGTGGTPVIQVQQGEEAGRLGEIAINGENINIQGLTGLRQRLVQNQNGNGDGNGDGNGNGNAIVVNVNADANADANANDDNIPPPIVWLQGKVLLRLVILGFLFCSNGTTIEYAIYSFVSIFVYLREVGIFKRLKWMLKDSIILRNNNSIIGKIILIWDYMYNEGFPVPQRKGITLDMISLIYAFFASLLPLWDPRPVTPIPIPAAELEQPAAAPEPQAQAQAVNADNDNGRA